MWLISGDVRGGFRSDNILGSDFLLGWALRFFRHKNFCQLFLFAERHKNARQGGGGSVSDKYSSRCDPDVSYGRGRACVGDDHRGHFQLRRSGGNHFAKGNKTRQKFLEFHFEDSCINWRDERFSRSG